MNGGVSSAHFVGRSEELARLRQILVDAIGDRSAALVVSGEAGVGKTRLVREFADRAGAAGTRVLWGSCMEPAAGELPYGPLGPVLRAIAQEELPEPGGVDSGSSRLLETLAHAEGGYSGSERGWTRSRLFEAVRAGLAVLADRSPILLVFDDIQWADESTRDLLTFLLVNLGLEPVAVVLTYRSDDLPRGHPVRHYVAELSRRAGVDRIELRRFNREELDDLLLAIAGTPPSPELVETIWERSEGNAFFAEELLAAARFGDGGSLPPTLHDILLARLQVLSDPAQRVLRAVAAGGAYVGYGLLAAATGFTTDELDHGLREALAYELLVAEEGDSYSFRHALLREVAYRELLPTDRARLHAAFARSLTEQSEIRGYGQPTVAADLARHWYAAGEVDRALGASVEAGIVAERVYGFAEAQRHFERALELWPTVAEGKTVAGLDRLSLLERAAEAAHLAGNHAAACALAEDASAEASRHAAVGSEAVRAGLLCERRGCYLWAAGDSEAALAAYEEAVTLVPADPPTAERARVVAALAQALMLAARYRESRRRCEEAITVARAANGRAEEAHALATLGFDMVQLGEAEAGVAALQESLPAAEDADPEAVGRAYLNLCDLLGGPLNRVEEAVRVALEGVGRARRLGIDRCYAASLEATAANGLFRLGRWDEADDLLRRALARNPTGAAAIDLYLARGKLSVGRGRLDQATDDLRIAGTLCTRAIEPQYNAPLCTLTAGLALWEGRLDDARQAYEEGLRHLTGTDDVWFASPLIWHGLRVEAEVAQQARAHRDAPQLAAARSAGASLLARIEDLMPSVPPTSPSSRLILSGYRLMCEAELSRIQGASDASAWALAAATWQRVGQPYPAAYARFRQAEALLYRSPGSPEARALLNEAQRVAVVLGAEPLRADIESLARRARIVLAGDGTGPQVDATDTAPAPVPLAVARNTGLTPREREVLVLVAAGHTNRQIASALFISEKTASVHVSNILAKLQAGSRVEAGAIAHRLGLAAAGAKPQR